MELPAGAQGSEIPVLDDLVALLAEFDVIDRFRRLPAAEQAGYSRWVEMATNDDARSRRLEALVLGLRIAASL